MKMLFIILSLAAALTPDEQLMTRLDRDSILIGDQVKWSISLDLDKGEDFFFETPDDPVAEGVETIRPFSIDTTFRRGGAMKVEGNMILTAFDSGSFFLPPLIAMVQRTDGKVDTMYFDSPALEVTTVPVDTANFEILDIKGQIKYPLTFKEVAPWALIALGVALIIFCIVWLVRNKLQNRDIFGRPIVQDPPHIVALRSLDEIRGKKLWQNNKQKQFYTEVTDAIRQYVAGSYDVPAMEQTTAEMFESLKDKEIDGHLLEEVKDLFATADFVKFAKHNATDGENEEAIPTAVKFVNTTYMQRLEKEKAEKEEEKD